MSTARIAKEKCLAHALPFVYRWTRAVTPLPVRVIRPTLPLPPLVLGTEAPPWVETGPIGKPFDFCGFMGRLCADIGRRCEKLRHLDVSRLLFGAIQARGRSLHGLQARVTPLRFRDGQLTRQRRGITHRVQRYFLDDQEFLYLVTFCLPRYLDQDFDDKLITLFHELYHISPLLDGDLRRHGGRYSIHSHSQRVYDKHMAELARSYLAGKPDPAIYSFLRLNFNQLQKRHGSVVSVVLPRPKQVPTQ